MLQGNAADAVGQQGHFLHRATNAEALKTAQFRDLEVGVGNVAFLVQEDFDLAMTFQAGDGVNGYSLSVIVASYCLFPGWFACFEQRTCQVEAIELSGRIGNAIQNCIDFFWVIAVDHRCKGGHQARAIVDNTFCWAITADALSASARAARITAAACGRAVAWDALFQQAKLRIDCCIWMRRKADFLYVSFALAIITNR